MRSRHAVIALALWAGAVRAGVAVSAQDVVTESAGAPLAARYEVRMYEKGDRLVGRRDWYLIRTVDRIETIDTRGGVAEVWQRDARGGIALQRVFHADRRVVEYSSGELKAMHREPTWSALASVVDPRELAKLRRAGASTALGWRTSLHEVAADAGSGSVRIAWIDDLSLPARIERRQGGRRTVLELREWHRTPPAHWTFTRAFDDYLTIDAADFGDMEYDAFVRKVEAMDVTHPTR